MDSLSERMADFARQLQDRQDDPDATFQLAVELARSSIDGSDGAALSSTSTRGTAMRSMPPLAGGDLDLDGRSEPQTS